VLHILELGVILILCVGGIEFYQVETRKHLI